VTFNNEVLIQPNIHPVCHLCYQNDSPIITLVCKHNVCISCVKTQKIYSQNLCFVCENIVIDR